MREHNAHMHRSGPTLRENSTRVNSRRCDPRSENIGKHRRLSPPDRLARLVPHVLAVLQAAWSPREMTKVND
jgi:hypothetical protein